MVRLIVTDYESREDYESFYTGDNEFESFKEIFVYHNYKKNSAYLPKSEVTSSIFSLNLLSRKYLDNDNFLVFISDSEFYILFNHKTVYSAKISENFITDDMFKSILITKHLAMLSSGGHIDKFYYLIDSKYRFAVENILKQNTKNEKGHVIAYELGHLNTLVKKIPEMDTTASYIKKNSLLTSILLLMFITIMYVFPYFDKTYLQSNQVKNYQNELSLEERTHKRLLLKYEKKVNEFNELTQCITNKDGIK